MPRKSLMAITFVTLGIFLALMASCKKGGPAQPYDVKLPDYSGDLTVRVLDKYDVVPGVTIIAVDPVGNALTGFTDSTGQMGFPINIKRNYVSDPAPVFTMLLPGQGIYCDSSGSITLENGTNEYAFVSPGSVTMVAVPAGPVSYASNLQTNIIYDLQYQNKGNLQVPVSLSAINVPSGWAINFGNIFMDCGLSHTPVTVTVPTNSYYQPGIQYQGFTTLPTPESKRYIWTEPTTIKRGYSIGVWGNVSVTSVISAVTGSFGFATNAPNGASFAVTFCVDTVPNGCGLEAYANSMGNSGTGSVNFNHSSSNGSPIYIYYYISNPDIGVYTGSQQIGVVGGGTYNVTIPVKNF